MSTHTCHTNTNDGYGFWGRHGGVNVLNIQIEKLLLEFLSTWGKARDIFFASQPDVLSLDQRQHQASLCQ
jgi:hypothetical protein